MALVTSVTIQIQQVVNVDPAQWEPTILRKVQNHALGVREDKPLVKRAAQVVLPVVAVGNYKLRCFEFESSEI